MKEKASCTSKYCDYCNQKYATTRENQRFCSPNCRKYGNKWEKEIVRMPYKINLNEDMMLLLEIAEDVQKLDKYGNCVSEKVMKAINLRHFKVICLNDREYLLKKWRTHYKLTDEYKEIVREKLREIVILRRAGKV